MVDGGSRRHLLYHSDMRILTFLRGIYNGFPPKNNVLCQHQEVGPVVISKLSTFLVLWGGGMVLSKLALQISAGISSLTAGIYMLVSAYAY